MKLESDDLWQYSLTHYPSIERELIALQDEYQLNINLLLLCGFAQANGCAIDEFQLLDLLEQTKSWNRKLTSPFRELRRTLKPNLSEEQYQQMLTMELSLEQEEQWRLVNTLPELPSNNPEAQANILSCLISSGVPLEALDTQTLATLFAIGEPIAGVE